VYVAETKNQKEIVLTNYKNQSQPNTPHKQYIYIHKLLSDRLAQLIHMKFITILFCSNSCVIYTKMFHVSIHVNFFAHVISAAYHFHTKWCVRVYVGEGAGCVVACGRVGGVVGGWVSCWRTVLLVTMNS
jgi:hypothetical protein